MVAIALTLRACSSKAASQLLEFLSAGRIHTFFALFQSKEIIPNLLASAGSVHPDLLLVWMIVEERRSHVDGNGGTVEGKTGAVGSGVGQPSVLPECPDAGLAGDHGGHLGSGTPQYGNLHQPLDSIVHGGAFGTRVLADIQYELA